MDTLEHNQQKILRTHELLNEIIKKPEPFLQDGELKTALVSQGSLAKYINKERGIVACSLNTYKTASESLLPRGFVEINQLRVVANNTINDTKSKTKTASAKRRVAALEEKVNDLDSQLKSEKKMTVLLTLTNTELLSKLKELAYSTDSVEARESAYKDAEQSFKAKLAYLLYGDVS
ncbi:Putative uncharacterized protein [Moritella viscosa]|uniref:hypothetical protein n=1 Tax=Moritella viscosa TaxID=80854 RepID=UPI000508EF6D|nr:hypothetical protein [Moritella viscosa]CED59188.1 putative uncharacterized protein [Moritella viscosa]SHO00280.1 Putative uncharacterized protein [Moritella viscosa]SHO20261.1 Putative uncharacterized protein [Moritella viscosa]